MGALGSGICCGDGLPEQRPLWGDELKIHESAVEMGSSLPPHWVDFAQEVRDDLKALREKLRELDNVQKKRLLRVFGDDTSADKDVEAVSSQISTLIRRCEQTIHEIKRSGVPASDSEREFRLNVQRGLATRLLQSSQEFRNLQKQYLDKIKARQKGILWDDTPIIDGVGGAKPDLDTSFTSEQTLELAQMEQDSATRSSEICRIAASISEVHTIFKELAVLVIDQGSILDRIDYQIEQVVHQTKETNVQLLIAERSQKNNRATKCIVLLAVLNALTLLVLILRLRS